ncbi:hypothetical protein TYRP_015487 [Tyrophagus putrescentiae]|nr:hypothetical protein TYRP_015487 [Tyrophagus putrescentiae]
MLPNQRLFFFIFSVLINVSISTSFKWRSDTDAVIAQRMTMMMAATESALKRRYKEKNEVLEDTKSGGPRGALSSGSTVHSASDYLSEHF